MRSALAITGLLVLACTGVNPQGDDAGTSGTDAGGQVDAGIVVVLDAGGVIDSGVVPSSDAGVGTLVGGPGPWPGPIAGVHYVSGAISGETDDAGTFRFEPGQPVVFSVGDVAFPQLMVRGATQLTAWQLAATASVCSQSPMLDKVTVLLFSLDADGDPSNGVRIALAPATSPASIEALSMSEVTARVGQLKPGRVALTPAVAIERFIRQVDDEVWSQQSAVDTFSGTIALRRGQGIATDGTSWFFSGTTSLERTDLAFNTQDANALAIPIALAVAGSDHIGDIDVVNGTVYAPIEDGSKNYKNPKVVTYSAQSLSAGTTYSVSSTLQTQGVPWVAVSATRNEAYLAEWDPTLQLNVFTLATMQLKRSVPLVLPAGVTLGRVQGAKVLDSALYLATDDAQKSVFKVDLETGTVLRLFSVDTTGEQEGLAFLPRPDGSLMHTLNITAARTGSELRHHRRTRDSLRTTLCH